MNDWLSRMRAAARAEPLTPDEELGVHQEFEEVLIAYFSRLPASEGFSVALEAVAEATNWQDAPAGLAASQAKRLAGDQSPSDVVGALGVSHRKARSAVEDALGIGRDAADLLLDRPAAVLLMVDPEHVRRLADLCGRAPGQLFAMVAASSRSSGGYVYAYRPLNGIATPIRRGTEPSDRERLFEWGYRFFDL